MQKKRLFYLISAILVCALILSAVLIVSAAGASDKPAKIPGFTANEGDKSYHRVGNGDRYGVRLNLGAAFDGFALCMPTNGQQTDSGATLSVYSWEGAYIDTVGNPPLASKSFEGLRDCATNWITFDELPAGEYLFVIENTVGQVGTWSHTTVTYPAAVYNNSNRTDGNLEITVSFTSTPETAFEKLSADIDPYGDWTAPAEYVIPEDSLIYTHPVMPDTWVFTDGLGRVSLTSKEVGAPREGKTVAMFYSDWHVDLAGNPPFNVNDFVEENPEAKNDYYHKGWPTGGTAFFWNEPLWGYYRTNDVWVLRKQAELLANAGVDTIFTDNTNGNYTWKSSYTPIYETWSQAMKDGVKSPKVSFLLPFGATSGNAEQIHDIYLDIYRQNRFRELWFYLDGKPMLMAFKDNFGTSSGLDKEIRKFFSWRSGQPAYYVTSTAPGSWGWLSAYPQALYYANRNDKKDKKVEQMTVGVAQNYNYVTKECTAMNGDTITGRSYTSTGYHNEENAKLYGYNFSEQFDYALEVDPEVIFVTGWNEWTAGRNVEWGGVKNGFPDQFNDEFSRDIEPSRGDLKDHYYYLLVNYVRKYKGCRDIPTPSYAKSVDINAGVDQWEDIQPYYAAYIGNAGNRDNAKGYGNLVYSDYSGRNDIIGAKVSRDAENLYFLVECQNEITPYTDKLWMNLYIDTDADGAYNGWESFDYVVGKTPASADKVTLEKFTGVGYDTTDAVECDYNLSGRFLQIKIPKNALGISGDDFTVNFAWTDNVHDSGDEGTADGEKVVYSTFGGDILDFYTSGDAAPGGRFKFSYISSVENSYPAAEETTVQEDVTTAEFSDETTEAAGTSAESDETTAEENENTGCGSVCGAIALIMTAVSACVLIKKKEN